MRHIKSDSPFVSTEIAVGEEFTSDWTQPEIFRACESKASDPLSCEECYYNKKREYLPLCFVLRCYAEDRCDKTKVYFERRSRGTED